jgi:electron transport complex protein RnfB
MDTIVKILFAIAALGGIGVLFALCWEVAGKKFAVEVDERVQAVRAAVSGANCGACGYAGCDAFAAAVVRGEASTSGCTPAAQSPQKRLPRLWAFPQRRLSRWLRACVARATVTT